jgi:hypothetical protein
MPRVRRDDGCASPERREHIEQGNIGRVIGRGMGGSEGVAARRPSARLAQMIKD